MSEKFIQSGELSKTSLVEVIGSIYARRLTGILKISSRRAEFKIYLFNGVPVNAQSSLASDNLFELLVKQGLLEREDVAGLERAMEERSLSEEEALLEMGVVTSEQIYYISRLGIRELIIRICGYKEGFFSFEEGEEFLEKVSVYDLNPLDIIYEVIERYHLNFIAEKFRSREKDFIKLNPQVEEFLSLPEIFYNKTDLLDFFQREVELSKAIEFLLNEFNDLNRVMSLLYILLSTEILIWVKQEAIGRERMVFLESFKEGLKEEKEAEKEEPQPDTSYTVVKRIKKKMVSAKEELELKRASFVEQKSVESGEEEHKSVFVREQKKVFSKPEIPRKLELLQAKLSTARDYFELLGVSVSSSIYELENAYNSLIRHYEVELYLKSTEDEIRKMAEDLMEKLRKIFLLVSNVDSRYKYEDEHYQEEKKRAWNIRARQELARKQFERGKWYMEQNRPDLALIRFNQAVEIAPEDAEYFAYLGFAMYRARRGTIEEVNGYLKQALGIDPRLAQAYYFLGIIAKREGDNEKALRLMERTLSLDPNHKGAMRELEFIKRHQKDKSILTRFFGGGKEK